jgi:tRNA threonylcarbamoyladenosine modification (KEOPS) complex Cgi121 subunit
MPVFVAYNLGADADGMTTDLVEAHVVKAVVRAIESAEDDREVAGEGGGET